MSPSTLFILKPGFLKPKSFYLEAHQALRGRRGIQQPADPPAVVSLACSTAIFSGLGEGEVTNPTLLTRSQGKKASGRWAL